jgi:hypothetical protein
MKFLHNAEFSSNINNAKHWVDVTISTDLNTINTEGVYRIVAGGTAHGNQPNANPGSVLIVTTDNSGIPPPSIHQIALHGTRIYLRNASWMGSSYLWGSWVQAATAPSALSASSTTLNLTTGHTHEITGFLTTGGQVPFPAAQNASSDANTLDDYEEGVFTPTIYCSTTAGTTTYGTPRSGKYTKIGNMVNFSIELTWTNQTGTGNMIVGGLPFSSSAHNYTVDISRFDLAMGTGYMHLSGILRNTTITLYVSHATGTIALAKDTAATLYIKGTYFVS